MMLTTFFLIGCHSIKPQNHHFVMNHQKVLQATGFSPLKKQPGLSAVQNKFAVEQYAALEAYRGLAKQIYSENLADHLKVADQIMADDSYRVYLDLFLRQAIVMETKIVSDQKKLTLALTLTPRFYRCISHSVKVVRQCIQEDGKIPFTRIGFQSATVSLEDLQCVDLGCLSPFYVTGFSKERNLLDQTLLRGGLYDAEWTVNMAVRAALRYFVLSGVVFK